MRIAVIGAGVVGSGLARVFLAAGRSVVISSRHPDRAAKVAAEIGAETVPSNRAAATGADLIVLAVPSTAIAGSCSARPADRPPRRNQVIGGCPPGGTAQA